MQILKPVICLCFVIIAIHIRVASAQVDLPHPTKADVPVLPSGHFSPSQVRTLDGGLIPVEQFFPASRCAKCHADTHAAWSESLHRNAAREPFYRESADILLRTRGIEFTRHCESCHTPVALVSGTLTKESGKTEAPFTAFDHEGVTCVVCHSIVEARLDGTGSYTIRRPALLAREDGTPVFGDFSDEQILADVPGHKRAMMRPLLRQPEFCATCHKVTAPPELNGYKQINGFSAYDEWQQSGASHESVAPFYRRDTRLDCRACHMPKIPTANDRAAKNGLIASHRWLGANTAAPLFYGQTEQARLTEEFLKSNHLSIDIFALRAKTNETFVPLPQGPDSVVLTDVVPGKELTAEIVVANRNVAHSFPPEVRDLYEAWVEFEVVDEDGKTIFHSGFVKPDGMLDERAYVYKTILLDEQARTITRHQIWLIKSKGYDNALPAGKSDLVRFRFVVPEVLDDSAQLTLHARVNYRRLTREYTNYVLKRQNRELTLPVVRMAETTVKLSTKPGKEPGRRKEATDSKNLSPSSVRRWNDYGIALLEQGLYGEASSAFRRAAEIDPTNPDLLVNAAIAELRTEQFTPDRIQQEKAAELIEHAYVMNPTSTRTRFHRAIVLRAQNKREEAASEFAKLAREYPRDREVLRYLGQTLVTLGRVGEARAALEAVLSVDPNDAGAYHLLSSLYASEDRKADALRAGALYMQWRDDPRAAAVALRFYAAHPEWGDVRFKTHVYGGDSSKRPVLAGVEAAPDK